MSAYVDIFTSLPERDQMRALDHLVDWKFNLAPEPIVPEPLAAFAARDFPPLSFLVDGLIARGTLTMLSARPKSGKTWFALQIARAVDTGTSFLGRDVAQARVLCLMLEGGQAGINRRIRDLQWAAQAAAIHFRLAPFDDPNGDVGPGLEQVAALAGSHDLIVIDTLAAALSARAKENDNVYMGIVMRELARIAHAGRCAILLVHHTNKGINDDVFNSSRGASAMRGAYDVGLVLERSNTEREAVLHVESRDFPADNIALRYLSAAEGWTVLGEASEVKRVRAGRKALAALEELGEATVEELAEHLRLNRVTVYKQLVRLESDGLAGRRSESTGEQGRPVDIWSPATGA